MKIGILGDIHGNIEALRTAYKTAKDEGADVIYHLGDLGGYAPFVNEVVKFLIENNIKGVQGNYDEAIAYDKPHCGCKYEDDFQAEMAHISFEWTKKNSNEKSKHYMKNLPFSIDLEVEDMKIKIFHATPIKNNLYWHEERPLKFFILMADKAMADVLVYGHTHIPYFKKINNKYFINAGSVGKPKDGDPRTCVCLIDISKKNLDVQFIRKEYEIQKVVNAIIELGLPVYFGERLYSGK